MKTFFSIPNIITTFRLLLIPLYILNLMKSNANIALITFTVIVLLDKLDGISARIANQITKFGRFYDGFADFILIMSSFIAFYITGLIEISWFLILLIPSGFLIITRILNYKRFKELISGSLGKIVVGISYVSIIAIIIDFVYKFEIWAIVVVLVYAYMIVDVFKILTGKKFKSIFS